MCACSDYTPGSAILALRPGLLVHSLALELSDTPSPISIDSEYCARVCLAATYWARRKVSGLKGTKGDGMGALVA